MNANPAITALYRYPVKGLTPERLEAVALEAGQTVPFDRAWAIENGPGRFDPSVPQHLPKINFLMLMRNERLAALDCRFDETARTLTVRRDGRPVVTGDLTSKAGRALIEQFFAAYMKLELRGPPRIVESPGHSFSDVAAKCVHLVNLATVRELAREIGRPIDPLRFRPNVVIDGAEAWDEFSWVGKEIKARDVHLLVTKRTDRCAATNVDPTTGARDMDIPAQIARRWGHTDFGIYAQITRGGTLRTGDALLTG